MLVNSRMYSVTPAAKAAWRQVLEWVLARAAVNAQFADHDPPLLLSDLWSRGDLAAVHMCGLPVARRDPPPVVLAAPVPSLPRYGARSVYMTDLAVRADATFQTVADTFGGVAGYTLKDSQSGYYAFRHLLITAYDNQPHRYRKIVGGLMNARGIMRALAAGEIDIGPLDAYAHDLIRAGDPAFAAQVRVVHTTEPTPMPPIVATTTLAPEAIEGLRAAFVAVAGEPALADTRRALLLERFVVPELGSFAPLDARARLVEERGEGWA